MNILIGIGITYLTVLILSAILNYGRIKQLEINEITKEKTFSFDLNVDTTQAMWVYTNDGLETSIFKTIPTIVKNKKHKKGKNRHKFTVSDDEQSIVVHQVLKQRFINLLPPAYRESAREQTDRILEGKKTTHKYNRGAPINCPSKKVNNIQSNLYSFDPTTQTEEAYGDIMDVGERVSLSDEVMELKNKTMADYQSKYFGKGI